MSRWHAFVVFLVVALPLRAGAEPSRIGEISALVGEGIVTHASDAEPVPLKVHADVFLRDRIETKEQAVARVLFGGRITVTIRERSVVTITDDPLHARVEIESGALAFKVQKNGLRPGEVAEIYTPNAVAGIRGSLVVAEVTGTKDNPNSDITVLEASHPITVAPRSDPSQAVALRPGHGVTVSGLHHAARIGPVRHLSRERLGRAADAAEVPGRPRDGGAERNIRQPERKGRAARGETGQDRFAGRPIRHR